MVASSSSIATANTVLYTIVADVICDMADELEKEDNLNMQFKNLSKTVSDHERIVFNGNGYSEAWKEEAKRRGLDNLGDYCRCDSGFSN